MNNLNLWENRLRRWTPRRPEARLKARLFAQAEFEGTPVPAPPPWGWLAPAMGTLLVAAIAWSHYLAAPLPRAPTNSLGLLARAWESQPAWRVLGEADQHSERNAVPKTRIEWTNAGGFRLSIGSLLLFSTNGLRY
jgi:hypothetical protein